MLFRFQCMTSCMHATKAREGQNHSDGLLCYAQLAQLLYLRQLP